MGSNVVDMTIEQFDALCTDGNVHLFSVDYQRRKAALLRSLEEVPASESQRTRGRATSEQFEEHGVVAAKGRSGSAGKRGAAQQQGGTIGRWLAKWRIPRVAAAVVVALCLAIPVGAYAVSSFSVFFDGAFGTVWGDALPAGESPTVTMYEWDVPPFESTEDQLHVTTLEIPCTKVVESRTFVNADGGEVQVSPLGISLDNETGLYVPLTDGYNMAHDPVFTQALVLHMNDGSAYTVFSGGSDSVDNTLSFCGFMPRNGGPAMLNMAFNRLIDPRLLRASKCSQLRPMARRASTSSPSRCAATIGRRRR